MTERDVYIIETQKVLQWDVENENYVSQTKKSNKKNMD